MRVGHGMSREVAFWVTYVFAAALLGVVLGVLARA